MALAFCLPPEGQHVLILVVVVVVVVLVVLVVGIITSFFDIETCLPQTSLPIWFLRLVEIF